MAPKDEDARDETAEHDPAECDEADAEDAAVEEAPEDPNQVWIDAIESLREELCQRDRKLREYIEAHQRAVQEMEAARQRMERNREEELDRHRGELARSLLEAVDDLDRTLAGATSTGNLEAVTEGVALVRDQMMSKLGELGVEPMPAIGEPFDPILHEAVGMVPAPDADGDQRVLAEQQAGYLFKGKVLRAAKVIVGTHGDS